MFRRTDLQQQKQKPKNSLKENASNLPSDKHDKTWQTHESTDVKRPTYQKVSCPQAEENLIQLHSAGRYADMFKLLTFTLVQFSISCRHNSSDS